MELEITGITNAPVQKNIRITPTTTESLNSQVNVQKESVLLQEEQKNDPNIQKFNELAIAFNKRLQYSYNDELNQVVVKVIDRRTDKVIKEIPPEELQRLHIRIRETIGLLFDQKI